MYSNKIKLVRTFDDYNVINGKLAIVLFKKIMLRSIKTFPETTLPSE